MKNYAFCPVSDKKINENVARCNAVFTVILMVLFFWSQSILIPVLLMIDFFIRSLSAPRYSPLAVISGNLIRYLPFKEAPVNAAPKIFAARIGFVFSLVITVLLVFQFNAAAFIVAGVLSLFAILEGVFGICVACIIYPYVYRFVYKT